MRPAQIKPDVHWVGAIDWNCRNFHGYSRSPWGTTYNAFLVKDEKTVLFDTVKSDFLEHLLCNVSHLTEVDRIDYIVANHLEPDHAGCLAEMVRRAKPEKIFCSPMGKKAMESYFDEAKDWPIEVVSTGDSVSIGKRSVQFFETRMLHWPDNMLSYIPEDKLAISSDAFGQNWATSERFADEVDRSFLRRRLEEYYANIVLPYSPVVIKTLDALAEQNLDIDMLCPDHGLIYRGEDVAYALNIYREFAEQKPQNRAVVFFDTMWHSTEKMALAVADGLVEQGVSAKVMSVKANHHSEIMTEVFSAGVVAVGSPTHNNGILPGVADALTYMKGLRPQNKIGGAFGSFGWSGECVKILNQWLEDMKFEIPEKGVKWKNAPTHEAFQQCYDLGKAMGQALGAKL
ncbi:MAG: FprA family A-type flavoprotein [Desulfovibrionaceae bacterium]